MKKGRKEKPVSGKSTEARLPEEAVPVRIEGAPSEEGAPSSEGAPSEEGGPEAPSKEVLSRADEYFERLQRLQADFDNYRKRVQKEKSETLRWANEKLIADLLPVLDNFDRALSSPAGSVASLMKGVEMIRKEMKKVLASAGLKEIEAEGNLFDPEIHEAIDTAERPDIPENTVVEERLKGYTLKGRLVRPAVVVVSTGGADKLASEAS